MATERQPHILNVEDEPLIRLTIASWLVDSGMGVVSAADVEHARTAFRQANGSFDLVILNVGLGDVDGLTLCEEFRAEGYFGPALIQSGYQEDYLLNRLLGARATDFLSKPFDKATLMKVVRSLVEAGPLLATHHERWAKDDSLARDQSRLVVNAVRQKLDAIRPRKDDGTPDNHIGHNGAPSELPLNGEAAEKLVQLLDRVEVLINSRLSDPEELKAVESGLWLASASLRHWLISKADLAADEAAKMIGKSAPVFAGVALIAHVAGMREELAHLAVVLRLLSGGH